MNVLCKITALLLMLPLVSTSAFAVLVDEVVATVDNEAILRSDVIRELGPRIAEIKDASSSESDFETRMEAALEEALDQAIEGKLLYKEALLLGAEIDDKTVDERVKEIQSKYESYDAFLKALEDAGETMGDFRTQVSKQIVAISMAVSKRKEFEQEAVITEDDLRQYYQDNAGEFSRPERVKSRRIFLEADKDKAAREKVKAQLEALRDEVKQGAAFGDLAKAHSQGPDAAEGGDMGWVKRGDLVPELEEALFATELGQMSAIVETEFGLSLFLAEEREEAGTADYEEARTDIEPKLRYKYAEERYHKWMDDLRARSQVQTYL